MQKIYYQALDDRVTVLNNYGNSLVATISTAFADMPVAATMGFFGDGGSFGEGLNRMKNSWKIAVGQFESDDDKSKADQIQQILSRHTWEIPFTQIGYTTIQAGHSYLRSITRVYYYISVNELFKVSHSA